MIAPDFRNCQPIQLEQAMKNYVSFNYGDGMWNDLAMEVQGVETSYNQMPAVHTNKTNA
jgi:hypothetical protein